MIFVCIFGVGYEDHLAGLLVYQFFLLLLPIKLPYLSFYLGAGGSLLA